MPVHVMNPRYYDALKELPCEQRVEKLKAIIELYSAYMAQDHLSREKLSSDIGAVLGMPNV